MWEIIRILSPLFLVCVEHVLPFSNHFGKYLAFLFVQRISYLFTFNYSVRVLLICLWLHLEKPVFFDLFFSLPQLVSRDEVFPVCFPRVRRKSGWLIKLVLLLKKKSVQFGSGKNTYITVSCKLSRKYPKTPKCLCIISCVVHQGVYISFRYFLRGNTLKWFATFAWKVECLLKVSFFFSIRTLPKDVIHARWFYVIKCHVLAIIPFH